jgi:hypothetical protein
MPTEGVGHAGRGQSPSAAADYIATITDELTRLARSHGLDSLAYILEMAHLEAEQIAKGSNGGGRRTE